MEVWNKILSTLPPSALFHFRCFDLFRFYFKYLRYEKELCYFVCWFHLGPIPVEGNTLLKKCLLSLTWNSRKIKYFSSLIGGTHLQKLHIQLRLFKCVHLFKLSQYYASRPLGRMLKVSRQMLADAADASLKTMSYYCQLFMLIILIVILWSKWENWAIVFGAFARESSRNTLVFA